MAISEWLLKLFRPWTWADRENAKQLVEWEMECVKARLEHREVPFPPNHWIVK